MNSKKQAEEAAAKLVEELDGEGWEAHVWRRHTIKGVESWTFHAHCSLVFVQPTHPSECLLFNARVGRFNAVHANPNEAVRQCLAEARKHVAELQAAISSVTGEEPRLFTAGEMEDSFEEGAFQDLWDKSKTAALVAERKGE